MKHAHDVDLRGHRWPLAALERKCAQELDAAALGLAASRRTLRAAESQLDELREACAREERMLTGAADSPVDVRARLGAVRYLVVLHEGLRRQTEDTSAAALRVEAAAMACREADRRLASVRKLEDAALAQLARRQRQRSARQADLAWIAAFAHRRAEERT